jgi:formate hydrogenlyase transcriptional activator
MKACEEIAGLKARRERENVHRQEEIRKERHVVEMVDGSRSLLAALREVETVAPIDSTVLISDETPGDAPVLPLRVLTPPLSSRRVDAVASRSPS